MRGRRPTYPMTLQLLIISYVSCLFWGTVTASSGGSRLSRIKRHTLFPENSGMGIFVAISIPIDLANKDVSISLNFEANYLLPSNASEVDFPIIQEGRRQDQDKETIVEEELDEEDESQMVQKRSLSILTRANTYLMLEEKMDSEGLPGRECLLRCICQAAEYPLGHNGLVGQLLHILLTPSTSVLEPELDRVYHEAEYFGLRGEDCLEKYSKCSWPILEVFTTIDSI